MIRKISAHYVFPLTRQPIKFGVIVFNGDGQILELIDNKGTFKETASLEFYDGIIVPGFIRSHHQTNKIIFEEIINTSLNKPDISLEDVLKLSILNKAKSLKLDNVLGSLDENKNPGINLITNLNFSKMRLTEYSQLRTIIDSCTLI